MSPMCAPMYASMHAAVSCHAIQSRIDARSERSHIRTSSETEPETGAPRPVPRMNWHRRASYNSRLTEILAYRPMVPLLVLGDSVLVFELEHVRILRSHGIVGVLIGSLPKAPQQNVFLGLPLQLSIYEAIWAVHANFAVLVDGLRYNEKLAETEQGPAVVSVSEKLQYAITPDTFRAPDGFNVDPFVIAPHEYIHRYCSPVSQIAPEKAQNDDFSHLENDAGSQGPAVATRTREFWHNYYAFKYLRELEYFMMPGLRFGGAFVAYPGDPLKFHSHLIVKVLRPEEKIDLLKIVTSGRLATAVKKAWLLIAEKDEKERQSDSNISDSPGMHTFSIEWAGFG